MDIIIKFWDNIFDMWVGGGGSLVGEVVGVYCVFLRIFWIFLVYLEKGW